MAAELIGLLDLSTHQLQKITESQQPPPPPPPLPSNPNSSTNTPTWMWKTNQAPQEDDDSWEVKAFEEDTASILGATWPPRSYTCNFCRREFRSAQALGGHMNVHRRDRARLHQAPPLGSNKAASSSSNVSPFVIAPQEFVTNGGLCFLYSLPTPNGVLAPPTVLNSCINSPSNFLPISPLGPDNLVSPCPPTMNFQQDPHSININSSSVCHSSNTEHSASEFSHENIQDFGNSKENSTIEEIDLELRLGRR